MATGVGSARQKTQPSEITDQVKTDLLPLEEQIRARAHQIWLKRDGLNGSAEADWLQAEVDILNETKT